MRNRLLQARLHEKDMEWFEDLRKQLNDMAGEYHGKNSKGEIVGKATLIRVLIMQARHMDKKQLLKECLKHR